MSAPRTSGGTWAPPTHPSTLALLQRAGCHDPAHMHLGIWETAGDARLPGRVAVASAGSAAIYGAEDHDVSAEEAASSLKLRPTRLYGRSLMVRGDEVAIPDLLDRDTVRQVPHTARHEPHRRPLESDLGTLSAVLMRGLAYRWQEGKPRTVVTLPYRVPPCAPEVLVCRLVPKLDALDWFARDFARQHRVPLFLGELIGDNVHERVETERGGVYHRYVGRRIARTASVACTDPTTAAAFAMMARLTLEAG